MSDVLTEENVKEALDWIAFRDDISRHNQTVILKDMKSMYPGKYQEWFQENKDLINKWNIPAN